VKYGHESCGTRNQEWLCWRGPVTIYSADRPARTHRLYGWYMDAYSFIIMNWSWSVVIATRLWAGHAGFNPLQGQKNFILSITFRPALGLTQPHIQWVPEAVSQGAKRQGSLVDHSPPSGTVVKDCGPVPPLSICLPGIVLNCISIGMSTIIDFKWIVLVHN
jgi:hypothetical protein